MNVARYVSIVLFAVLVLFSGLAQNAYAARAQRVAAAWHPHFKSNKNMGPYGGKYLAPKKQKKPTGYYRSTLTGKMVYGKPGKH